MFADSDPHQREKLDSNPDQSEKQDQYPDPHQSEGYFGALEGPNFGKSEW